MGTADNRRPSARRIARVAAWFGAGVLLAPGAAAAAAAPGVSVIAPRQELVVLLGPHTVHRAPTAGAPTVAVVSAARPLTGERTTLPVLGQHTDSLGRPWLQVRLPGRTLTGRRPPSTGWITTTATRRARTDWHILVTIDDRRVRVYRRGRLLRTYRAIVGAPTTPTPRGDYFVEENLRLPGTRRGAPYALALNARSRVFQTFDGGPGQIALHGQGNLGGKLGTASSHGCVRLTAPAITWLAARTRPGVPVTIE